MLLCTTCRFCLQPGRDVWLQHLRQKPHCLQGALLRALVKLFRSYNLLALKQVAVPTQAVASLQRQNSFQCLTCSAGLTQSLQTIQLHVFKVHRQKPALHKQRALWWTCKLQTFFAETRLVRYFAADEATEAADVDISGLRSEKANFFKRLDKNAAVAEEDAEAKANIVHGFNSHRSAVML